MLHNPVQAKRPDSSKLSNIRRRQRQLASAGLKHPDGVFVLEEWETVPNGVTPIAEYLSFRGVKQLVSFVDNNGMSSISSFLLCLQPKTVPSPPWGVHFLPVFIEHPAWGPKCFGPGPACCRARQGLHFVFDEASSLRPK